jgi:hypothetical protein
MVTDWFFRARPNLKRSKTLLMLAVPRAAVQTTMLSLVAEKLHVWQDSRVDFDILPILVGSWPHEESSSTRLNVCHRTREPSRHRLLASHQKTQGLHSRAESLAISATYRAIWCIFDGIQVVYHSRRITCVLMGRYRRYIVLLSLVSSQPVV